MLFDGQTAAVSCRVTDDIGVSPKAAVKANTVRPRFDRTVTGFRGHDIMGL